MRFSFKPTFSIVHVYCVNAFVLDLESIITSKMSKNFNGEWQCNDCYKTSKVKTNIYFHIEANHVDSPGYQCNICYKFCTTSNALRTHKYVKHKNDNYSYQ